MQIGQGIHCGHSQLIIPYGSDFVLPGRLADWPPAINNVLSLMGDSNVLETLRYLVRSPPRLACVPAAEVGVQAPILRPPKNIICLGWNYAEHARESAAARGNNAEQPAYPIFFTKAPTSICGPYDDVVVAHDVTSQLDWEVELAIVIGKLTRCVSAAQALHHVFGYTVVNDLSARDIQFRHKQYFLGKSLDGACPMGPYITTAEEIPDPQCLKLSCRVNGVLKQDGNTSDQIFSVAQVIETLSSVLTLEPGDIIATGTPSGVGFARSPPEFLKNNDVVECFVESVGTLKNRIVMT